MNLDTRFRDAIGETLATPVDPNAGLVALRRTRRNRAVGRFGACAVAVALVLTGVARCDDTTRDPSRRRRPDPDGVGSC